ncbi:MAG: KH domain-containing protein [Solirubrobacteraceae bacterium]|nr:KH domain-containing protein [Patulibacter sp.]
MSQHERNHGPSSDPADPEGIEAVRSLVEGVARALGIDEDVVAEQRGEELHVAVQGKDLGLLIGRHGQTLEALQHLAQRIALDNDANVRVIVDAEGYRERRREAIEAQVNRLTARALQRSEACPLEPMTSSERRYVHEMVRDIEGVESYSEGTEPDRHAVIAPEGTAPPGARQ